MQHIPEDLNLLNPTEVAEITAFLAGFDIRYEGVTTTAVVRVAGAIVATGSLDGNVLKYFFVDPSHRGQNLVALLYTHLLDAVLRGGHRAHYVFTSPDNLCIFRSFGLKEVHSTDKVSLLEGGFSDYGGWVASIRDALPGKSGKGARGAVVVNCNPMTLGHLHLIREAKRYCDALLVFVVEEDASVFPTAARHAIVAEALREEPDIHVFLGGPYIISKSTFPTYFIKRSDAMLPIYAELDAGIFGSRIARDLSIDVRFFGEEPKDEVTRTYMEAVKALLTEQGVEVRIFTRIAKEGAVISASRVRQLLSEDRLEEAFRLLPEATIRFLQGKQGEDIIWRIRNQKKKSSKTDMRAQMP